MKRYKLLLVVIYLMMFLVLFMPKTNADGTLEELYRNGNPVYHTGTSDPVMIPKNFEVQTTEFRGVWVATVYNLNMPKHTSEAQYKAAYQELIQRVKSKNMNAILFQTRPLNDAFYESNYAPFSRYLTGTEGISPGWDVMEYMVSYAHSQGIEFHAWMNPYRVANSSLSKQEYLNTLHASNFARQNPDYVISGMISDSNYPYILDPGRPQVQSYLKNIVLELITKYDVDGVHFDDYFYPYSGMEDSEDQTTYNLYNKDNLSRGDWRRKNVDDAIKGVKQIIDSHNYSKNKQVRFGISPFGIWRNKSTDPLGSATAGLQSYDTQYADSRKWVKEGWIHYICPQVYWEFTTAAARYADVTDWWADVVRGTGVDLIIGHSITRASYADDEISTQLKYNQKHPEIIGDCLYSAGSPSGADAYMLTPRVTNIVDTRWTTTTTKTWKPNTPVTPTVTLSGTLSSGSYKSDVKVTLSPTAHIKLYRIDSGTWQVYKDPFTVTQQGTHTVEVKTRNVEGTESPVTTKTFTIAKTNSDVPTISVTGEVFGSGYKTGATVKITANKPSNIRYQIGKETLGPVKTYTGTITLLEPGLYTVIAYTIDGDGVKSNEVTKTINIRNIYNDPVITISGTGNDPYYKSLTATISGDSPVMEYRINEDAWQTYTEPIVFDIDGEYTLETRNDDDLKNVISQTFTIIKTPPKDPEIVLEGILDGEYYTSGVTISFTQEDGEDVYFQIHDGSSLTPYKKFTTPHVISKKNNYLIRFYAIDKAQNKSEPIEVRIKVDIPFDESYIHVIRDNQNLTYRNSSEEITLPSTFEEKAEIRAVWVSTVSNIDIPKHINEETYKAYIINMLETIKNHNLNTIFFQVRSMNDAFYPSEFAPISRYIMGIEGMDPGWDIFRFVLDEAHARGIEVHAWLNPYRVSTGTASKAAQLAELHDDNFAKQNPNLVIADTMGSLILNPGEPRVRAYIKDVIQELMTNYNIDGVHFDDYFYSYAGTNDSEDNPSYTKFNPLGLSKADWRRYNVDALMESLHLTIKDHNETYNSDIKFGISPFGIWRNQATDPLGSNSAGLQSYDSQFADSRKWVMEGWLDYILPQIYWEFSRYVAPYADIVKWWAELTHAHNVDLIIGHGFYRFAETPTTWINENELIEQIRYSKKYPSVIGSSFFTYNTLNKPHAHIQTTLSRLKDSFWTKTVDFPWDTKVTPTENSLVLAKKETLRNLIEVLRTSRNAVLDSEGKEASELDNKNYYAPLSALQAVDEAIASVISIFDINVSERMMDEKIRFIEEVDRTFRDAYFKGEKADHTEEVNALKEEIKELIHKLKASLETYAVTTITDPNQLQKDKKYITQEKLDDLNRLITEIERLIDEEDDLLRIKEAKETITTTESDFKNNIIIGTKPSDIQLSDDMKIILIALGGLVIFIGLIFIVKRKKK